MADVPQTAPHVLAIGEAKATEKLVGDGELDRLTHVRDLLPAARLRGPVKLLLVSRSGFTKELQRHAASRHDVELVDLERLYLGQ